MSLIDVNDTTDLNQLENDLTEAVGNKPADDANQVDQNAKPADANEVSRPDWIDEKFWTGNTEESAQKQHEAYLNLQSAHGRMANDLGVQRKLTDRILNLEEKRENDIQQNTPDPVEVSGADLLNNPTEALDTYLEQREAGQNDATSQRLSQLEAELANERFVARHPDFNQVAASSEFSDWVNQTPYRAALANSAQQGDMGSASALLDEFKASQPAKGLGTTEGDEGGEIAPVASGDLTEEARAAALESTSSGENQASGKTYSRAALMRLRVEKPDVYGDPAFQSEIMKAYSEGRVK